MKKTCIKKCKKCKGITCPNYSKSTLNRNSLVNYYEGVLNSIDIDEVSNNIKLDTFDRVMINILIFIVLILILTGGLL